MVTGAQMIAKTLVEEGVEYAFWLAGGPVRPVVDALYDYRDKIKVILCRDEQTASCMAESYGQMTGKPGVFLAQEGFAVSTGLFGVLQAYLASSPMLVLTGLTDYGTFGHHAPFQCGSGHYGCFDARQILQATTKYSALATTPLEAVQCVQLAIKHALSGRPGPAAVVWSAKAMGKMDEELYPKLYPLDGYLKVSKPAAPAEEVHRVVQMLLEAQRPVIIAGNGARASRAHTELRELAEKLGMPVATSALGKGVIRESHPLAAGPMGDTGSPVAQAVVGEADLLLIIGSRLKPQDTSYETPKLIDPNRQTLIQIDIDPRNAGWQFPIKLGIAGDAKVVLRQMLEEVDRVATQKLARLAQGRTREFRKRKEEAQLFKRPDLSGASYPLLSGHVVKVLRDVLDPSAIVTTDGGNNRHWMLHLYETRDEESYFGNAGLGGMSYSIPTAMTAKLLHPEKQCVAVCGDGGFMMQIHALSTALQHGINFVAVVFNDSALGMSLENQGARPYATEFIDTDFAAIARGFGCFGVKVQTSEDLYSGLKEALSAGRPAVVDVAVQKGQKAQAALSSRLGGEVIRVLRSKGLFGE